MSGLVQSVYKKIPVHGTDDYLSLPFNGEDILELTFTPASGTKLDVYNCELIAQDGSPYFKISTPDNIFLPIVTSFKTISLDKEFANKPSTFPRTVEFGGNDVLRMDDFVQYVNEEKTESLMAVGHKGKEYSWNLTSRLSGVLKMHQTDEQDRVETVEQIEVAAFGLKTKEGVETTFLTINHQATLDDELLYRCIVSAFNYLSRDSPPSGWAKSWITTASGYWMREESKLGLSGQRDELLGRIRGSNQPQK